VWVVLLLPLLLPLPTPSEVGGQAPPPDTRYRTVHTEHFRVTYPAGLAELAGRAAQRAEEAHALLRESFLPPPAGPIDLLLTDHVDLSNGFARVFPSNRIVVWAHPPLDGLALSQFDDWLEMVILHEVAHIFHLDVTGPLGRAARRVFGRAPYSWPYFTGHTLPGLAIEGVAVHLESLHTPLGRLEGGFHPAVARTQALAGREETVGQAMGGSPTWPAGDRRYVYGSLFFRHLADTHGEAAVVRFLVAVADQWIPYRLDAAAREAFGASFTGLWEAWMDEVAQEAHAVTRAVAARTEARGGATVEPELLTRGGRFAAHPAPGPGGVGVAYLREDGRNQLRLVLHDDAGERSLGRWNTLMAPPRWGPTGDLFLPQAEYLDRHRLVRDLYRVTVEGEVTRLTRGLRVLHADPHPDGDSLAAVLGGEGTNRLVILSAEGEVRSVLREAEPGVHWSHPAWAPDGDRLAVVRRRPGGWTAVLVLGADGTLHHEIGEDRSLNAVPTWSPSGDALLWGSDRSGIPNLYAVRFDRGGAVDDPGESSGSESGGRPAEAPGPVLQVTDLVTAGIFPSVDPEGRWIYFSLLGADGWEVARVPYRPEEWFAPLPADAPLSPGVTAPSRDEGAVPDPPAAAPVSEPTSYSAIPSLLPRFWLPVRIERETVRGTRVLPEAWGASTSGVDLVGRHEYSLFAAAPLRDPGRRVEWGARYAWAGLGNPVVIVDGGQEWEAGGLQLVPPEPGAPPVPVRPLRRERFGGLGVEFRHVRLRRTTSVGVGGRVVGMERRVLDEEGGESETIRFLRPEATLLELRGSAGYSSVRSFPFSVSPEEGLGIAVAVRERWDLAVPDSLAGLRGVDGGLREARLSVRGYRGVPGPGHANHVLAFRVALGASAGPSTGDDPFRVGGSANFLGVRGFAPGSLWGRHGWAASAEWRFPLAILHRGFGAFPLYLDRLAGSVFVEAGGAGREVLPGELNWESLSSVGGEIVLSHNRLFGSVERLRLGAALPLDGSWHPSFHLRTGWSF